MKAVVIHATGGSEQLTLAEMPDPLPGPGEVLLDVAYAGCNWADTQVRMGIYPHAMTYPMVLGFEVSGTVAALGPGVSGVKVGDRVATFPDKGGAYAEKCVAPAAGLIKLPDGVGLDVSAAFPIQALTAYHMLYTIYGLERGDTVLVNAVGGGVGLACTQLASHAGARVIGTTGRGAGERAGYGASKVVVTDRRTSKNGARLHRRQRRRLAIDSYGATMLDRTFNVVKKLGHVISIGGRGQPSRTSTSASCPDRRLSPASISAMSTRPRPPGRPASITCWQASPRAG